MLVFTTTCETIQTLHFCAIIGYFSLMRSVNNNTWYTIRTPNNVFACRDCNIL